MKPNRFFCLLLSCLFVSGCLSVPSSATSSAGAGAATAAAQASRQFESSIPAGTIGHLGDGFLLEAGDTVSYNCTYTPRDAGILFGYIAPDGLFYGISGSKGSLNKSIQVSQRGVYTLAVWNVSDVTVTSAGAVKPGNLSALSVNELAYMDLEGASPELREEILDARAQIVYNTSWTVDGAVSIRHKDGTKEKLPEFSDLFPDWDLYEINHRRQS